MCGITIRNLLLRIIKRSRLSFTIPNRAHVLSWDLINLGISSFVLGPSSIILVSFILGSPISFYFLFALAVVLDIRWRGPGTRGPTGFVFNLSCADAFVVRSAKTTLVIANGIGSIIRKKLAIAKVVASTAVMRVTRIIKRTPVVKAMAATTMGIVFIV